MWGDRSCLNCWAWAVPEPVACRHERCRRKENRDGDTQNRLEETIMRSILGTCVLGALSVALVACAPAPETKTAAPEAATPAKEAEMKPERTGYAEVNGIKLYHEIYGSGEPLVLIHGGLTTIGEMQG